MPSRVDSNYRQLFRRLPQVLEAELIAETEKMGRQMERYKKQVVSSWRKKPRFVAVLDLANNRIALTVEAQGENGQIWRWVDEGTGKAAGNRSDDYPIRPKAPGYPLRFQTGYNARTQPVAAYDVGDGSRNGDWVSTYEVRHPGIEPREFTIQSRKMLQSQFRKRIMQAIQRGIRKAKP